LIIPIAYIRRVTVMLNHFNAGATYSEEAFNNARDRVLNLFPLMSGDMTAKEKERIKSLSNGSIAPERSMEQNALLRHKAPVNRCHRKQAPDLCRASP
jgi:hypothetical protein